MRKFGENTDFLPNIFAKMGELFAHIDKNILILRKFGKNTDFSHDFCQCDHRESNTHINT